MKMEKRFIIKIQMVSNVGQNKVIKEENKMIAIICDRCGSIVEDKIKVTTKDGVVDAARVKLKIQLMPLMKLLTGK